MPRVLEIKLEGDEAIVTIQAPTEEQGLDLPNYAFYTVQNRHEPYSVKHHVPLADDASINQQAITLLNYLYNGNDDGLDDWSDDDLDEMRSLLTVFANWE